MNYLLTISILGILKDTIFNRSLTAILQMNIKKLIRKSFK